MVEEPLIMIKRGGGAYRHGPLSLLLSSHGVHGTRNHWLRLRPPLQLVPLFCACGRALGLSSPCSSHAEKFIYHKATPQSELIYNLKRLCGCRCQNFLRNIVFRLWSLRLCQFI